MKESNYTIAKYFSFLCGQSILFPWCLKLFNIEIDRFLGFIEIFVRSNREIIYDENNWDKNKSIHSSLRLLSSGLSGAHLLKSTNHYLERNVSIFFSELEQKILKSLAWKSSSFIWQKISLLQINPNYNMSSESKDIGVFINYLHFPLMDDIQNPGKIERLLNSDFSLNLFFRKFYILATNRIKFLIKKLEISKYLMNNYKQSNITNVKKCFSDSVLDSSINNKTKEIDEILFQKILLIFQYSIANLNSGDK